ncbi:MAG: LysM peptidoglycan-binding domain-containing protein [Anaerolineales bacterium]|nr:LysM peptidoglycan-binding domain-containing protein [Anaerolineales bacterium]
MSPETPAPITKLCPTCGTRLAENASRCSVCRSEFTVQTKSQKAVQGSRMPEITISLPLALGLLIVILFIGAAALYFGLRTTGHVTSPTEIPTATLTPTNTPTPTETLIPTETPTPTQLPPLDYIVKAGDNCVTIAFSFDVSPQSIILLNNLSASCTDLIIGQTLKIPQPTPTPLPAATATLESAAATRAACQTVSYTVQENDTLSSISLNYNVTMAAIKEWNGLSTDNVYLNQPLTIPLCMRAATPGPSPTPIPPAPYLAPNLLLPADGAPFTLANDIVTLQWASVGTLRENEAYMVTVVDVTAGTGRKLVQYAIDTKFIVPVAFRPLDNQPHAMRWWVVVVRQTGTDDQGNPIWTTAGALSNPREFTWTGTSPAATPTP